MRQTISWTAIPNGIVQGSDGKPCAHLSVVVSPRLEPDGDQHLSDFAPFGATSFAHWPPADLTFDVKFTSPAGVAHVVSGVAPVGLTPDPASWSTLFPPNRPVRSYAFRDMSTRPLLSFGSRVARDQIRTIYTAVLANPGLCLAVPQSHTWERDDPTKTVSPAVDGLIRAAAFFERPPQAMPPAIEVPMLDFHEELAALGAFPLLCRRLGLTLELVLPLDDAMARDVSASGTGTGSPAFVSASPKLALSGALRPTMLVHRTAYRLAAPSIFRAAPGAGSAIAEGRLHLDASYELESVDTDGGAIKVAGAFSTMRAVDPGAHTPGQTPAHTPETISTGALPQLRTVGIALLHDDRGAMIAAALKRAAAQNTAAAKPPPAGAADAGLDLFADDLVRGLAVDICDVELGRWRSLTKRHGRYVLFTPGAGGGTAKPLFEADDEGWIAPAVFEQPAAPGVPPGLRVSETVFRWDGWSISAPRPGHAITDDHQPAKPRENRAGATTGLVAEFDPVPGSLPALRFGRSYSVTLRAIDLAGNPWATLIPTGSVADAEKAGVAPIPAPDPAKPFVHYRFEPVPPPLVVSLIPPKPGESLERIVLRSDVATPPSSREVVERHLTPPPGGPALAEHHGKFDRHDVTAPVPDPAAFAVIRRHLESFEQKASDPPPTRAADGSLEIPFLPDPLAAGMMLRLELRQFGVPNAPDPGKTGFTVVKLHAPIDLPHRQIDLPHRQAWPETGTWRLVVAEIADKAEPPLPAEPSLADPIAEVDRRLVVSAADRTVTIRLRKAEQARLSISSTLAPVRRTGADEAVLNLLGLWAWFLGRKPKPNADQLSAMTDAVLRGIVWLYTPYRTLDLVHAVRNPLLLPALDKLNDMTRTQPSQTWAGFSGVMPIDGLSTLKVDLEATWTEIRDVGAPSMTPGQASAGTIPSIISCQAHAAEIAIAFDQRQVVFGSSANHGSLARHEFHDTRHRVVTYTSKATTRFREYFQTTPTKPGKLPPAEPASPLNSAKTTRGLLVPSSRRPDRPKVAYVVPTFTWTTSQSKAPDGTLLVSDRGGGGLRVWLERPWFSSGNGEKLAVIFAPDDNSGGTGFTQIARDPIWGEPGSCEDVVAVLDPDGFFPPPLGSITEVPTDGSPVPAFHAQAVLPELGKVRLVAFDVAFHGNLSSGNNFSLARDKWFVDLTIPPDVLAGRFGGPYAPFVRLALARYQPNAVPGCELSPIVFADFMPLLPERRTVLHVFAGSDYTVDVFVVGKIGHPIGTDVPDRIALQAHAFVQSRHHGDTDLAWNDVDDPTGTAVLSALDGPLPDPLTTLAPVPPSTPSRSYWRGLLRVRPDPKLEYRVVVVESETIPDLPSPPASEQLPLVAQQRISRTTLLDTIVLPPP